MNTSKADFNHALEKAINGHWQSYHMQANSHKKQGHLSKQPSYSNNVAIGQKL